MNKALVIGIILASTLFVAFNVSANEAQRNLDRLQNQQHIWATQRHHQAERNRAYQQGIQRSQERTNRVLQGQPPQIGGSWNGNLQGW